MSYLPVSRAAFEDNREPHEHRDTTMPTEPDTQFSWPDGPRTLKRQGLVVFCSWVWDSILTICPIFFVVLAILSLRLDGQAISSYGKALSQITLLSPTIYPVLFAAVAGRFYKNLARWRLEKREGIELAVLEQIFGSQSVAGALERLLFVRTQVLVGLLILLTWGLSPLGGQSAARLLYIGTNTTINNGTIYYVHPSYQDSSFQGVSGLIDSIVGVNTLYISSLLSSSAQKRSSRDLWNLPRIPQWPAGVLDEEELEVGQHSLGLNDGVYASLLGTKIQGLNFPTEGATQYHFTIETSYFDFDCDRVGTRIPIKTLSKYFPTATELFRPRPDTYWWNTFAANLTVPDTYNKSIPLNDVPPGRMLYVTLDRDPGDENLMQYFALFNCSMRYTILHTDIQRGPSPTSATCKAIRQRRVNARYRTDNFPTNPFEVVSLRGNLPVQWRIAEGQSDGYRMSPTDNYLAGDVFPISGKQMQDWSAVNTTLFSRRLTTAFNTYYQATLSPLGHTNVSIPEAPYSDKDYNSLSFAKFNSTRGTATTERQVYRANRQWVSILLTTSIILEILALAGIVLECLIQGPDVLGFASSMTRDNPYVSVPSGGTALDGPDRARVLRHLRVHLADVYPANDMGYIALRNVPSVEQRQDERDKRDNEVTWRPFDRRKLYI